MSTSSTQFAQLISMLNQRVGLTLQACEGACAFLDRRNAYWQLSLGQGSDVLAIQAALGPLASLPADTPLHLLHLNTDLALLRGAALGVDPVTRELLLLYTVSMDNLEAAQLESILTNLMTVRDMVHARLHLPAADDAVQPGIPSFTWPREATR
jgi:hypothetical protein